MRKIIIIIIGISIAIVAHADDGRYEKAMMASLAQMDNASNPSEFQSVANKFKRIGDAEREKWLPFYYASYAMIISAAMEKNLETKDINLDAAQQMLDQVEEIDHDESERLALQGFIYMIRIGVDPASRGQEYSMKSANALQQSKKINPENPRALFMMAQLSYGTAQFFGSEITEACQLNDTAIDIFETYKHDKDNLLPHWGKNQALEFKKRCLK